MSGRTGTVARIRAAAAGARPVAVSHSEPTEPSDVLPDGCPVIPLGKYQDVRYYLDADKQLIALPARDHSRLGILGLFGRYGEFLYSAWPRTDKSGMVTGWRPELAAESLMRACSVSGVWDPAERERGRGAWKGEAGELVMHVGSHVLVFPPGPDPWRNQVQHPPGLFGRYVYPAGERAGVPADTPGSPGQKVLQRLSTWSWRRGELDAVLLLGWIGAAMIGGALAWRPVAWVTGGKGTGKSTLHELLRLLLDQTLVQLADTSEAYVRQRLRHQTLPVAVDELEAEEDNRKAQGIIKLARIAASGGSIGRGGSDHTGVEFTLRSAFLFSSILVPPLLGQDRSRIAILELAELPPGAAPPALDPAEWRAIGAQLRRRMIDGWARLQTTLDWYRTSLQDTGHSARGADQFGVLLACADILLFDGHEDTELGEKWVQSLAAPTLAQTDDSERDEELCLRFLLQNGVDPFRNGVRRSLGEWVRIAANQQAEDQRDAQRMLGTYGLSVRQERGARPDQGDLAIANSNTELARLFAPTHWGGRSGATGVWAQALRRLPGARPSPKVVWFAGQPGRCTLVPLSVAVPEEPAEPLAWQRV